MEFRVEICYRLRIIYIFSNIDFIKCRISNQNNSKLTLVKNIHMGENITI